MKLLRKKQLLGAGGLLIILAIAVLMLPQLAISVPVIAPAAGDIGLICTNGPTFDLKTASGFISMPDGNSIFMWGYAMDSGSFQMPGPVLCVDEGDTVTVNLTNDLPVPVSIIFPGQTNVTATGGGYGLLTSEAQANGGTVSYSFVANEPGTYLYETGTNQPMQINMGLYGALVVRPTLGANYAYNDAATQFGDEFLILMHEIDPALHTAVQHGQAFDITTRHDRYWTINGRSLPDTLADNGAAWLPNQPYGALVRVEAIDATLNPNGLPALIRYANAGTVNHPYHPHGDHLRVIAQDGRPLGSASFDQFTRTMAAGQTADMLFTWENVEQWTPGANGPLPVTLPNLQNLVFKDGVTFYSGDPHLGQSGELPFDVTSFNECGEFYFPWHSHALNEFQNFDEGFGGLATLVRVDPPGGCP